MKKILIVGANSYIGNSFVHYMETISSLNDQANEKWIIHKIGASKGEWKSHNYYGYDSVLHVAAIVHKKESKETEELYYRVNRDLAIEVAKKAKESGVGHFVFLSSMAVYGDDAERITQDTEASPTTYYGKSKLEAEKEILKLETDDFKIAIVRPPMVYGEGCKGNYARLVKLAKILSVFPKIYNKRSVIHIDKLCEYLKVIIENNKIGIFHPQNSRYITTTQLYCEIRKNLGKRTYEIEMFNLIIMLMANKILSIRKMFGDCYYELELTNSGFDKIEKLI